MKNVIYRFYVLLLISLFVVPPVAVAQTGQPLAESLPNPYKIFGKYVKQNNYITPLFELKAMEDKYLASPIWKEPYLESMILLEGWVGNYDRAYAYENTLYETSRVYKQIKNSLKNEIPDAGKSPLADYKTLNPLDAIENAAVNRQVIMINEEHHTPFHRAVTLQLLKRLYDKGFRYFALEALYIDDSRIGTKEDAELNNRGFPTHKTGYYTDDPVFADAIRTALKLGYKVVPYEAPAICEQGVDRNTCSERRERGQAQNIYDRILKDDPQAKILVHVGRSHNSKFVSNDNSKFMASYFREITKIEPFTIDQLHFSERLNTANEQPLYRYLTRNNLLQKPSVYQSADGSFYNQTATGNDMVIFHPRMRYENGRATFLQMNGLRKAQKINLKKFKLKANKNLFDSSEPVLIQAFYSRESEDAVPIDQIILYQNKEIPVLMLPSGSFRIRAMDKAGNVTKQYEKRVN
jgi:hypothetical protein